MLTPLELENKKVQTKGRKYFKLDVDEYLDLVFENYKGLYEENEELKKQVKTLTDGIQYYRSIESTMQKALVLAEKTSKETKDAAVLKAEAIEKDAKGRANKIVSEAEAEYDRIRDKCLNLVQQFNKYKQQLQSAAHEQLRLVTSASFEVDTPDIEGRDVESVVAAAQYEPPINNAEEVAPAGADAAPVQDAPASPVSDIPVPPPSTAIENLSKKTDTKPLPKLDNISQTEISKPAATEPELKLEPAVEESSSSLEIPKEPVPDKTMVLPDVKSVDREAIRGKKTPLSEAEQMSILTAETIDLGDSIRAIKETEGEQLEVPSDIQFESEQLEVKPEKPSSQSTAQGLDSILQSMSIGKKNTNEAEEDPFEFLGSVDDF